MRLAKDFWIGVKHFMRAFGFMIEHKMLLWFIFPFIISALMLWGGLSLTDSAVKEIEEYTYTHLELEKDPVEEGRFSWFWEFWETCKSWFNNGSGAVVGFVVKVIMWLVMAIMMKYILLVVLSPVLAFLSEKVEEKLTGNTYPFIWTRFMKDIWRGVLVASRNFIIEMVLVTLIWILSIVFPIIAPITLVLTVLISAYYYGFSMIDYVNERRRLSIGEGARFVRNYKGLAVAVGIFIAIGMKVPVLGFIFASFASMLGAVAAVTSISERVDLKTNRYAINTAVAKTNTD